jgi:hypothetical protein
MTGQGCQDRTARTELPGPDNLNYDRPNSQDMENRIGQPDQDRFVKTK